MPDTFCPLPWVHQAFRNNGDVRVCCQANQSPNKGIVTREDGSTFNAATATLDESRNSPLMNRLRKNMISGEWWVAFFPGLFVLLCVWILNQLSDAISDFNTRTVR